MNLEVNSEIGKLEGVLLHTPGPEVENMTPRTAERALYSDILNLKVAKKEYSKFKGVLKKVTETYEIKDLLTEVINNEEARTSLLNTICENEQLQDIQNYLNELPNERLIQELFEGVPLNRNSLTNFLNESYYHLRPLHNFFFTRDSAVTLGNEILINKMKNKIRKRESLIIETIFKYHPNFNTKIINPKDFPYFNESISIEGGDVHVLNENTLIVGTGARTSTQGVDFLIEYYKEQKATKHIIAQELPKSPESFIHLDMVFTILDRDKCMIYPPVIQNIRNYKTVDIFVENGKLIYIKEQKDLITALANLKIDLEPIICGGLEDEWNQEREQWHSGANFVAIAPGKVMGYSRNNYTLEDMNNHGFEIIRAKEVINDKINIDDYEKCVITIDGSELARGGGGCRCMSMPLRRAAID